MHGKVVVLHVFACAAVSHWKKVICAWLNIAVYCNDPSFDFRVMVYLNVIYDESGTTRHSYCHALVLSAVATFDAMIDDL